jgi:hypothetical protein
MNSTEGSADRLEKQIGTLKGGMQGFFRTIATGSWESLIGNITKTAEATKDLVDALDDLEDVKARNALNKGDLEIKLSSLKLSAAEETDPEKKKALLQEAIDTQKRITEIVVSEYDIKNKATEEYYKKVFGHDEAYWNYVKDNLVTVAKNYEALFGQREFYELRLAQLQSRKQMLGSLTKEQEKERRQLQMTLNLLEDYDKIQNDISKKGQFNEYLMGLGAVRQAAADGAAELLRMTKQVTTLGKTIDKEADKFDKIKPGNKLALPFGKGEVTGKLATRNPNEWLVNDAIQKNADRATEAIQRQQEAVDILASAFQNLFQGGEDGFKNMVDSIISSIGRLVAELLAKAAVLAIMNLLFPGSALLGAGAGAAIGGWEGTGIGGGLGSLGSVGGVQKIQIVGVTKGKDIYWSNKRYGQMLSDNT